MFAFVRRDESTHIQYNISLNIPLSSTIVSVRSSVGNLLTLLLLYEILTVQSHTVAGFITHSYAIIVQFGMTGGWCFTM